MNEIHRLSFFKLGYGDLGSDNYDDAYGLDLASLPPNL